MKNLKIFLFVCLIFLSANSAFSQGKFLGKVVDVLDGKTVVIELPAGKVTAVLQFIEIPEPEQAFSKEVKNHLRALTFGKTVEFKPLRVTPKNTVGLLTLDGVDISNQMLRDGAAWYALPEKTGQNEFESHTYQDNEKQARMEKRGIWSVENLRPAWEVRAEAEEKRRQQGETTKEERAALEQFGATTKPQKIVVRRELSSESQKLAAAPETTIKLPPNFQNIGGLLVGYDPALKFGLVATPMVRLNIPEDDGKQALTVQIAYLYYDGNEEAGRKNAYVVGVDSESRDFRFLKYNELIVTVDKIKINLGKAKRFSRKGENSVREGLLYEVKKPILEKIANGKNVSIKVGTFSDKVDPEILTLLQNLISASQ